MLVMVKQLLALHLGFPFSYLLIATFIIILVVRDDTKVLPFPQFGNSSICHLLHRGACLRGECILFVGVKITY